MLSAMHEQEFNSQNEKICRIANKNQVADNVAVSQANPNQ